MHVPSEPKWCEDWNPVKQLLEDIKQALPYDPTPDFRTFDLKTELNKL